MSINDEKWGQKEWEQAHAKGYATQVFSVTHDKPLCDTIIRKVNALHAQASQILIPGCGSVGLFEKHLSERNVADNIICTDFPGAIKYAPQPDSTKILYAPYDSTKLPFRDNFDVVIPINAVVSGEDEENKQMLQKFHQATTPGGHLIGLFPTILAQLDLAMNRTGPAPLLDMDLGRYTRLAAAMPQAQLYYTPTVWRKYLLETGYDDIDMKLMFFDSEYFTELSKELYEARDTDMPYYELLITAQKPMPQ